MSATKDMNEAFLVVIPARYASTRLPGKPLVDIAGKPMIQRVYEQACKSQAERVIIATDDERILEVCQGFGAEVQMTKEDHPSGTDRLEEVVTRLGLNDRHIVVNVQGDEPLLPEANIDQVAYNLAQHQVQMATLCDPITDPKEVIDPNAVKVVMNANGMAMYFSRAPIPWSRSAYRIDEQRLTVEADAMPAVHRHIGIYAYRVSLLRRFVKWGACDLERTEALEQLRAMWHGVAIHCEPCQSAPAQGVDTLEDLEKIRALF